MCSWQVGCQCNSVLSVVNKNPVLGNFGGSGQHIASGVDSITVSCYSQGWLFGSGNPHLCFPEDQAKVTTVDEPQRDKYILWRIQCKERIFCISVSCHWYTVIDPASHVRKGFLHFFCHESTPFHKYDLSLLSKHDIYRENKWRKIYVANRNAYRLFTSFLFPTKPGAFP